MTEINIYGASAEELTRLIKRVEDLEDEKAALSEDISSIFKDAKSKGFNVRVMKEVIRLRKKSLEEIEADDHMLDVYKRAMGMLPELDKDI